MDQFQLKEYQECMYQKNKFDNAIVTNNIFSIRFVPPSNRMISEVCGEGLNFEGEVNKHKIKIEDASVESQAQRQVRNKQQKLVEETCCYLKNRLHEKNTLDGIANFMGTNRSKLAASFKKVTGKGVFEWLRERRMIKAKTLLLATDLSVQQIAFEVGFDNCANFSTAFKKYYEMSPRKQRSINLFVE